MTLSEITALGIPSILVPSSYVAENHQEKNARALESEGGCRVILDNELTGRVLYENIIDIITDEAGAGAMGVSARKFGITDADIKLSKLFDELINRGE